MKSSTTWERKSNVDLVLQTSSYSGSQNEINEIAQGRQDSSLRQEFVVLVPKERIEFSDLKIITLSFGVSALQRTDLFIPENCFTTCNQITHILVFLAERENVVDSHAESCQISLQIYPHQCCSKSSNCSSLFANSFSDQFILKVSIGESAFCNDG